MAQGMQEEKNLRTQAYDAILKEIPKRADGASAAALLDLAQAYAWVVSPTRTGGSP